MRSRTLLVVVAVAIATLLPGSAAVAVDAPWIDVDDDYFTPQTERAAMGDVVRWEWQASEHAHSADDTTGRIRSGFKTYQPSVDVSYERMLFGAGTYQYACRNHGQFGMKGRVRVPMKVTGYTDSGIRVRWGSMEAPDGWEYDVQHRLQGGTWAMWQDGTTKNAATHPYGNPEDPHQFRARLRHIGVGATAYSPVLNVAVV